MRSSRHRISPEIFSALAEGSGGREAIDYLAAVRRSKTLLLIHTIIELATAAGHDAAPVAVDAYRTLCRVEKLAPRSVQAVLNYPSVGAWALRTVVFLHHGKLTAAQPALLATAAAAAAVRGGVAATVILPTTDSNNRKVVLPSLGVATFPSGTRGKVILNITHGQAVLFDGVTQIEIPRNHHQDAHNWRGIREISAECSGMRISLFIDGWGPHHFPEAVTVHEDPLNRQEFDAWRTAITAGWRILAENHREVAAEVAAVYTMLVPLRGSATGQVSVTLGDAFGCVAMSLPPDPPATALTLAHEVQHAKLSVLMDLFPLVDEETEELFYAPWRNDPRPLIALLQGAYAHLGIAAFWRRQGSREQDAERAWRADVEFARWCMASREVTQFLANSQRLTAVGQRFVSGMLRVLDEWSANHVSRPAMEVAQQLAKKHRERWQRAHG